MGVAKRGKVYHYEFVYRGVRFRGSTGATNRREAEEFERQERERVKRISMGRHAEGVTLKTALSAWFEGHARHLASARTIAFQLKVCARVFEMNTDVSAIDTGFIAQGMAARRAETTHNGRRPSNATVNREIIDTLRPALKYARRHLRADIQSIDWEDLRLKETGSRHYEFTAAEVRAVAETLLPHHRIILAFFARYGVRLKEAWFPLRNLDDETGRIMLRERKGGEPHTIRLIPADLEMMRARAQRAREAGLDTVWYREHKPADDGSVRISAVPPATFQTAMKRAYARAGIEGARAAHEWRHHAGTAFLRATGDLAAAQRLLGHAHLSTTRIYARPAEDAVYDALTRMAGTPHKIPHRQDRQGGAADDGGAEEAET